MSCFILRAVRRHDNNMCCTRQAHTYTACVGEGERTRTLAGTGGAPLCALRHKCRWQATPTLRPLPMSAENTLQTQPQCPCHRTLANIMEGWRRAAGTAGATGKAQLANAELPQRSWRGLAPVAPLADAAGTPAQLAQRRRRRLTDAAGKRSWCVTAELAQRWDRRRAVSGALAQRATRVHSWRSKPGTALARWHSAGTAPAQR